MSLSDVDASLRRAPLIDALAKTSWLDKPPHRVKVGFIEGENVKLVKLDSKPVIVSIKYFILMLSSGEVFGIGNEFCWLSEWTIVPSWSSSQIMQVKLRYYFFLYKHHVNKAQPQ